MSEKVNTQLTARKGGSDVCLAGLSVAQHDLHLSFKLAVTLVRISIRQDLDYAFREMPGRNLSFPSPTLPGLKVELSCDTDYSPKQCKSGPFRGP